MEFKKGKKTKNRLVLIELLAGLKNVSKKKGGAAI